MTQSLAAQHVQKGDLTSALSVLQETIRDDPSNAANRVFLFQLLCVMGDWNRALIQLNVAADLDNNALLMAQAYRELLHCEAYRAEVFAGHRSPLVIGEPPPWIGSMFQALDAAARGDGAKAKALVHTAFDAASARAGSVNDIRFGWLADADMRLGPLVEAIINGKYYWVPMNVIGALTLHEPEDLRDLVWLPAQFTWVNEDTCIGFVPVRYPESAATSNNDCALSRKTEWIDIGDEFFVGVGQRMLTSNDTEFPLLQVRRINFDDATG